MIDFDFAYYRPDSVQEAVSLFTHLDAQGKQPLYYGGGTEIISMARANSIHTEAVIDYKALPDCNVLDFKEGRLVMGSALTLTRIAEAGTFPLLGRTVQRIADHTIQDKITLGGNLSGTIVYRESVLPLLLTDSQLIVAGPDGLRQVAIGQAFDERLRLNRGELLVQIVIPEGDISLPSVHTKRTKLEKIGYPLITIAALLKDGLARVAFSGLCAFPFRSLTIEGDLNQPGLPLEARVDRVLEHLPAPLLSNLEGSSGYRAFVLRNALTDVMRSLKEV